MLAGVSEIVAGCMGRETLETFFDPKNIFNTWENGLETQ